MFRIVINTKDFGQYNRLYTMNDRGVMLELLHDVLSKKVYSDITIYKQVKSNDMMISKRLLRIKKTVEFEVFPIVFFIDYDNPTKIKYRKFIGRNGHMDAIGLAMDKIRMYSSGDDVPTSARKE